MKIIVEDQLIEICRSIEEQSLSESAWAEKESDDEFQTKNYCGGFDADVNAFCFSHFASSGSEYLFQLSLKETSLIKSGTIKSIEAREADK